MASSTSCTSNGLPARCSPCRRCDDTSHQCAPSWAPGSAARPREGGAGSARRPMSKHDFPVSEFEERRARVRAAIAAAGLDWLVLIHPVSIHWLTGSDAKSYQEFQCLLLSAEPGPLTVLTREGEAAEFADDALVDRVEVWGGRELDDPIAAFARVAGPLGLTRARVGLEVPAYYLHPRHYLALKALLGAALVAEPTDLVHDLKLVKSPA